MKQELLRIAPPPPRVALPALAQPADHGRQLRRRQRERAEEGLLRAVREDRHQGRAGRIQRRAGQDQGHGRDQEGHLGRGRGRVARRRARLRRGPVREARLREDRRPRPTSLPAAVTDCGVGIFVWSTVMAYNGDKLKDGAEDLGRLLGRQEIPGQARHAQGRALQPRVRADGRRRRSRPTSTRCWPPRTAPTARSRSSTELKPNIQWWEAGAQPPQFLVAGDVVDEHRLQRPHRCRQPRRQEPEDHLDRRHLRPRLLGHPEGHAEQGRGDEVHRLRQHARRAGRIREEHRLRPDEQRRRWPSSTPKVLANLPTSPANATDALQFNLKFWADQGEELEKRFASWATQ